MRSQLQNVEFTLIIILNTALTPVLASLTEAGWCMRGLLLDACTLLIIAIMLISGL